jgi:hypothetical protein
MFLQQQNADRSAVSGLLLARAVDHDAKIYQIAWLSGMSSPTNCPQYEH